MSKTHGVPLDSAIRETWLEGYECGFIGGIDRGLQIAHEQDQREWQNMRAFIRARANNLSYAELAERRGEPAKAQRQREILAANGVGL